jgi:excisionase family DNA binding protein
MTTRRRRDRVRIRVHGKEVTTPETKPRSNGSSRVGNPSYAKARAKVQNSNGQFTGEPEIVPEQEPVQPVEPVGTIPQPNEEALRAKELVSVDDILRNPVLTPNEVGTLLRVSPETVLKLCQDGELPPMRVKRETRILRIDVLRYMRDLRDRPINKRRAKEEHWT